jgi:capsid protein
MPDALRQRRHRASRQRRRNARAATARGAYDSTWTQSDFLGAAGGHYPSCDPRRKLVAELRNSRGTPDQLLRPSLHLLQAQCAKLDAATPLGRGAVEGFAAELIGSGIDILPRCPDPIQRKQIKREWRRWTKHAGTRGQPLALLQAQAARSIPRSGGCLWRWVIDPDRTAKGWLPIAIVPLPIEWLSGDEVEKIAAGNTFLAGIEYDKLDRPVAYHLRNPAEAGAKGERVAAEWLTHIWDERLPGMSIGEPGLAPAVERVWQDGESVVQELRASATANAPSVFTTAQLDGQTSGAGDVVDAIPAGSWIHAIEGETFHQVTPERPNTKLPEFRGTVRGDVAAIARTSQRYLDRNNERVSYSSSRDDQLRSRRLGKLIMPGLSRFTASEPYERVLPWILLRLGIPDPPGPMRQELYAHEVMPDMAEPANQLEQIKTDDLALRAGTTSPQRIASRDSIDWDDLLEERRQANEDLAAAGLPPVAVDPTKAAAWNDPAGAAEPVEEEG